MKAVRFLFVATIMALSIPANAHDTWVEVNSAEVRLGQVVHVDLKLGNHGNNHRDFKLASKITLALAFDPTNRLIGPALARGFQGLADRMVDDFVRIADLDE